MTVYDNVHIGWIDFIEENWRIHGYNSIDDWQNDIEYLNNGFQVNLQQYWLDSRKLSFSDNKNFKEYLQEGLLVSFNDVFIDYRNYYLYLSVEFVDLKTRKTLLKLKKKGYYGDQWGFKGYLSYALDALSQIITMEILQEEKSRYLQ